MRNGSVEKAEIELSPEEHTGFSHLEHSSRRNVRAEKCTEYIQKLVDV